MLNLNLVLDLTSNLSLFVKEVYALVPIHTMERMHHGCW